MAEVRKTQRILVKDLNPMLTCSLCDGYFIDATSIIECHHTFCRSCILKYFKKKRECPSCPKTKKDKDKKISIKPDEQMQALLYKMIPGLYANEMLRRAKFHKKPTADDSAEDESDEQQQRPQDREQTAAVSREAGHFYGPDDLIQLSLEYYQLHLDNTNGDSGEVAVGGGEVLKEEKKKVVATDDGDSNKDVTKCEKDERVRDRRYLRCAAAVSMSHLHKFLRMKYALSPEHKVEIIYEGEVLPTHFNLMDVAYTFKWTEVKPMRFFYRIFTPMKIQPIKIINTSSTRGTKQLQIVPIKPNPEPKAPSPQTPIDDSHNEDKKEQLMKMLKLQSKHKAPESKAEPKKSETKETEPHCVYEYEEPDNEEKEKFAAIRDREWANMKHEEPETHHVSKKRKKNKHSKSDVTHKKRKLHAEITGELKVKLTPHNGHKHKHHKSQPSEEGKPPTPPMPELKKVKIQPVKPKKEEMKDERTEKSTEEQKTFLKTFQSGAERIAKCPAEIVVQNKVEKAAENNQQRPPMNTYACKPTSQSKSLEKKIASLQCTIEPAKNDIPKEKKVTFSETPHILNSQYPAGFTVSKIDSSTKRKPEPLEDENNKRPTLEITLIQPTPEPPKLKRSPPPATAPEPPKAKRPPPPTIPLERIKKSVKSSLTIIPKSDNNRPLDLSKPHKVNNGITLNGFTNKSYQSSLSNLQMLSKVATEQSSINKPKAAQLLANNQKPQPPPKQQTTTTTTNNKPKPQMPSLQTLNIPSPQSIKPNLPNLQHINKNQLLNGGYRNMRPSQNQSIRNIPNPSLLVQQQNQNRMNSQNLTNGESKEQKILNALSLIPKEQTSPEPKKIETNGISVTPVSK
ncbi:PREDICTED: polycomb group protein Psc-like isoform X2 [Nicrophorus vespilloides]|uniref:Polycomb group protein Psc-like isoform X2 n=1 Tax=Nicrophorus vespilloides TaxID=110193 RepID=A0ABM1MC49_NICVS|nr:PREDICTED: polycomb group protein Psc-like isoform X2 [Nicrophorus vespilloides]